MSQISARFDIHKDTSCIKVALYTKGSTIYEHTSQYGDLNILWKCLYRSTFLYIIIAQWSRAFRVQILRKLLLKVTKIIFWKSYFYQKWFFICFLCIHICHMLPHFSWSNYFISFWRKSDLYLRYRKRK